MPRGVPRSSAVAHKRGRVGGLSVTRAPDDPELISARQDLVVERLVEHAERVLAKPLTDEQRDRIAALLQGGDAQ